MTNRRIDEAFRLAMTGTSTAFLACWSSSRYRSAALVKLERGGEVVERLGEMFAPGFQGERQPDLLGDDLLFEQRRQHDGAHPGVGQRLGPVDVRRTAGRPRPRSVTTTGARDRWSSGPLRPAQSSLDLLVVAVPAASEPTSGSTSEATSGTVRCMAASCS